MGMENANGEEAQSDTHDAWLPLRTVTAPLLKLFHAKACCSAAVTAAPSGPCEKQQENCNDDGHTEEGGEQRSENRRDYVDRRLKEIAAFERRARGEIPRRRK
jgi:hypothetical protein